MRTVNENQESIFEILKKEYGFREVETKDLPKYQTPFTRLPILVNGDLSASRISIDNSIIIYINRASGMAGFRTKLTYLNPCESVDLSRLKLSYLKI